VSQTVVGESTATLLGRLVILYRECVVIFGIVYLPTANSHQAESEDSNGKATMGYQKIERFAANQRFLVQVIVALEGKVFCT
jgi:hypothetical protein